MSNFQKLNLNPTILSTLEKKGYSNDWDGRYGGKLLPEGVYYFVMGCPDRPPMTGNILLAR